MKTPGLMILLLLISAIPALSQATDADLHRAVDGALRLKKLLRDPNNLVMDSVVLVAGKHGNDVCYSFHSRSAWDFIGKTMSSTGGLEVNTADVTTGGKLRVWPPERGKHFRPCSQQEKYSITDITKEVREAGGFLP
jgi:hypothetical protein